MELVEAKALKSSVRREQLAVTVRATTHHALLLDDFNSSNAAAPAEDFSVDCFLDFSNPELGVGSLEFEQEEEKPYDASTASPDAPADDDNHSNFSDSLPSDEPSLPVDDYVVAGLEWVSHFVDDSLPVIHAYCPVDKPKNLGKCSEPEPEPVFVETPGLPAAVPAKARTKRSKPTGSLWSGLSGPMLVNPYIDMEQPGGSMEPPRKKPKRKPRVQADEPDGGNQFQRRCSHCQVQKTPQWRTGPLGPKTLCNACGVRYKSGRLYPEYRPACSPSFSGDVHSNSHRKVLEIRKKKESDSGLTRMVQSF